MDSRINTDEQPMPKGEFPILFAALSLLKTPKIPNQNYQKALQKLIDVCWKVKGKDADKNAVIDDVNQFIKKFERKSHRYYGDEAFDLRVISASLNNADDLKKYLRHDPTFIYSNDRQLINIVSKTISHFRLKETARLFKKNYFDQVNLVNIEKYLDPDHKKGQSNPSTTRYASLLTTMSNGLSVDNSIPRLSHDMFEMYTGWRLVPRNKLLPRLPLTDFRDKTPSGQKYDIKIKEHLDDDGEMLGTEALLKYENNRKASKTPGPLYLSSFPIVTTHDALTQTLADLIANYHIAAVLDIDEKIVAEYTIEGEAKALPADWIKHNVAVDLIQCPDLHAMRVFHTLLAAQRLFSQVLTVLPPVKDDHYTGLVKTLMAMRFEDKDQDKEIKSRNAVSTFFHKVVDDLTNINYAKQAVFFNEVMVKLQWSHLRAGQLQQPVNQGNVLVHCKAGMSRSATALLSMYIMFIDVIMSWHAGDFIHTEKDKVFFGAILNAIFYPGKDPIHDVHHIVRIFSDNYRVITPLEDQVIAMAQLIQHKRGMLLPEADILRKKVSVQEPEHRLCFPEDEPRAPVYAAKK